MANPEIYRPDDTILKNYADVLVKFALNFGNGINEGEVVQASLTDASMPFFIPLQTAILEAGGHPLIEYQPQGAGRAFYEVASNKQLDFTNEPVALAKLNTVDRFIDIIDDDPHELEGISDEKITRITEFRRDLRSLKMQREAEGKYSWTLALYGTPEKAHEAGMTLEEYWQQIIQACFLDKEDPIAEWRRVTTEIHARMAALNELDIKHLHAQSVNNDNVDLHFTLGEKRRWNGGDGENMPNFEIYTSPDWRGTNGIYRPNQPVYTMGKLIQGIELVFNNGEVISASAEQNEELLHAILKQPNANRVGECSFTDGRLSRITRFMAETLYDENRGGPRGNMHIATGHSYSDTYDGETSKMSKEELKSELERLGFNPDCPVHEDMISTDDRIVTATLGSGEKLVIYENGEFTV